VQRLLHPGHCPGVAAASACRGSPMPSARRQPLHIGAHSRAASGLTCAPPSPTLSPLSRATALQGAQHGCIGRQPLTFANAAPPPGFRFRAAPGPIWRRNLAPHAPHALPGTHHVPPPSPPALPPALARSVRSESGSIMITPFALARSVRSESGSVMIMPEQAKALYPLLLPAVCAPSLAAS